jgi:hypothetical protein
MPIQNRRLSARPMVLPLRRFLVGPLGQRSEQNLGLDANFELLQSF